jgi:hypothetical protein
MTTVRPQPVPVHESAPRRAPRGGSVVRYLHTTDPKDIAILYLVTAFGFFLVGGLMRDEFATERPGSYGWDYLDRGPARWRIRISKLTAAALPRIVGDTATAVAEGDPDTAGAV